MTWSLGAAFSHSVFLITPRRKEDPDSHQNPAVHLHEQNSVMAASAQPPVASHFMRDHLTILNELTFDGVSAESKSKPCANVDWEPC